MRLCGTSVILIRPRRSQFRALRKVASYGTVPGVAFGASVFGTSIVVTEFTLASTVVLSFGLTPNRERDTNAIFLA